MATTLAAPPPADLIRRQKQTELCRGWSPRSLVTFYELIFAPQGFRFLPYLWPFCMGYCDTRINKLMFILGPGVGKSLFLSVTIPAWQIGHNPDTTVLGISGGEALMQGFQSAVAEIIATSSAWKEVFPTVEPDYARGWSVLNGLYVTGRKPGNPDANYLAAGIDSKFITGKHGNLLLIDDIHNEENSSTADQCERIARKYAMTIVGRANPTGARFIMAGRRWNVDDVYGQLKGENSDWVIIEIPHERPGSERLYADIFVPDGLECVFTDHQCRQPDGVYCHMLD